MSRRSFSFYDLSTGLFSQRAITCRDEVMAQENTPTGYVAKEGRFDHLSQRVDLRTGEVIDYQPVRPSDDYEWDDQRRRWVKRAEVLERERKHATALTQIQALELRQLRPMRELAIDPTNEKARERLNEIEAQIAEQRTFLVA